jgi:hypothetical protein
MMEEVLKVLTRGETREDGLRCDHINEAIASRRAALNDRGIVITTINITESETWLTWVSSPTLHHFDSSNRSSGWDDLDVTKRPERISASTRATTPTATTVSAVGRLLELRRRDERLARMPPDRRTLYHRILNRREAIGPVDLDVVQALKELRSNG